MQNGPNVDRYLQNGIYGTKEIKPEERERFLGTLRERVVVALTKKQVKEPGIYKEVEDLVKSNIEAKMYLNGNMSYTDLSDYIRIANENGMLFTMVVNKDGESDLGLVLAYDHAIDMEEIFIQQETNDLKDNEEKDQPLVAFFKSLFN
ncbi:YueI family protein [Bacillus sp. DJP31]|uniref:YueI family protein n=1 Tax=Bacillus sp. DJP31 TaxID=3409789 RepID=UPI003BB5ABC5